MPLLPNAAEIVRHGPRRWIWITFSLAVVLILSGCSATPASLRRHAGTAAPRGDAAMVHWLEQIAAAPESKSGKEAGGRFMEVWCKAGSPPASQFGPWKVRVTSEWKPGYFDTLLPAADYDVRGLDQRHTRAGLGVALIGCRKNTHREPMESLYPPELITRPVAAVFTVSPDHTITIALQDPMRHAELAADFTAPFAELLEHTGALQKLGFGGLLGSRDAKRRGYALYLMEPYDPRKTPVLFVHGLLSTPLAWANVTNEMWGDAEFRRRYQIWHYHYPTSAPFLYSAKMLRQRLGEARSQLDPRGEHLASARLHVVAHSMGGLLTRTLITDSGEAAWNGVFRVPPKSLRGAAEDRAEVMEILHWKARRDVRHVIFIAVPHRGSSMAPGLIGRVGDALTGLPTNFKSLYARLHRDNPDALQPAFREALSRGKLTSIDTLSPQHPLLAPLNALPFAPLVSVHSIIGNRGAKSPSVGSSDGVVPYASSHLDAALSELIVPTGHDAYRSPKAVAEILRILTSAPRSR